MNPTPLNASHIAFMCGAVSMCAASCDSDGMPQLARGLGCRVAEDGSRVTVFVPKAKSLQLVRHAQANGALAVVFTQPSTHRTIQLKGRDACVVVPTADDEALVDAYRRAFVHEVSPLGFPEEMARALLASPPGELVGLSFTPTEAYTQTPGPNAGKRLEGGA